MAATQARRSIRPRRGRARGFAFAVAFAVAIVSPACGGAKRGTGAGAEEPVAPATATAVAAATLTVTETAPPAPGGASGPAGARPPLVVLADADAARRACEELTPPLRRVATGGPPAGSAGSVGSAGSEDKRAEALRLYGARYEEALATAYAVEFGAADVRLAWDAAGAASVAVRAGLRAHGGALVVHVTDAAGDSLVVTALAEAAEAVRGARAAARERLRVIVLPDPETMIGAACFGYPGSGAYTLYGRLLEAAVFDGADGTILGRTRTVLHASWTEALRAKAAAGASKGPAVRVGKLRVATGTVSAGLLESVAEPLAARLLQCWREALAKAPSPAGTLILTVQLDGKGRVRAAGVSIDGLRRVDVASCALEKLTATDFPKPSSAAGAKVDVPVFFDL